VCSFSHNLTPCLSLPLLYIHLSSQYIATDNNPRTAEAFGYYLPFNLGGAALAAIGYGLMSMFKPTTPTGKWVGFQIIYGLGSGAMVSVVSSRFCFPVWLRILRLSSLLEPVCQLRTAAYQSLWIFR
jgi:hypothetical protein